MRWTERRAALRADAATTCYRELHGAADGAPANLCVDRYGEHLLVQRPEDVPARERDAALAAIDAAHAPTASSSVYEIVTRVDRSRGGQPLPKLIRGPGVAGPFEVLEHGTAFRVELGEKKLSTGLFLDQRPQRLWLRRHAANLTVLNLFAHAGAYSAAAAAGGAARTLSVSCGMARLPRAVAGSERVHGPGRRRGPRLHLRRCRLAQTPREARRDL